MESQVTLTPIGTVRSPIREPVDDIWGGVTCRIELDRARFKPSALSGLDGFSHVEIICLFHQVKENEIEYSARHPRSRKDWPLTGIFAQRGKNRPNRLDLTTCRVVSVHGLTVEVEGLDAVEGTPVLDIKPYMNEFAPRGEIHQPAWSTELRANYRNQPK